MNSPNRRLPKQPTLFHGGKGRPSYEDCWTGGYPCGCVSPASRERHTLVASSATSVIFRETFQTLRYKSVLKYFKPESTIKVTTFAEDPSFSATRIAACTFPPEEVPAKIPSFPANCRAISFASAVFTDKTSSTRPGSHRGGR